MRVSDLLSEHTRQIEDITQSIFNEWEWNLFNSILKEPMKTVRLYEVREILKRNGKLNSKI